MQENLFSIKLSNYWRNVDKKIFFCFVILFFLGLFFSYASTSSLAGERLNKDNYFFLKTFNIYFSRYIYNVFYFIYKNPNLKKLLYHYL